MEDQSKESKLLSIVKADYDAADIVKEENDSKVAKWVNVRDSALYGTEVAHKSKYVSDLTKNLLQWQIPSMVDPLVSSKDLINCKPFSHMDMDIAKQEQAVLTHFFLQRDNHYEFATDLITAVAEEGTCFVKTGWEYYTEEQEVEKEIIEIDPMSGQPVVIGYETVTEQVVIENRPTKLIVPLADVRMDPTARGVVANANFVIHSFETDLSSLKKENEGLEEPKYTNLDELEVELAKEDLDSEDTLPSTGNFEFEDTARRKITVIEYWGNYDLNEDGIAEPIVVTRVGDVIIRQEDNPLPGEEIPFEKAVYSRKANAIYGEALAELTAKRQNIDSVLMRGILDDLKQAKNGQTGTKKGFTDERNLEKMKKGMDFEYNTTMADVYEGGYTPINQSVFQVRAENLQNAQSITGVNSMNHGNGGNALGSSAAAVNATTSSSAKREMHIVRGIVETCIIPVLRKYSKYCREFLSPEEVMKITDKPYIEPSNAAVYDIKISLESVETRAAKAQSTGFVLQTMGPNMPQETQQKLLARYMNLVGEVDLAEEIANYQPQPDPMAMKIQELEIAKLEAQVQNEFAKARENEIDYELKSAKTANELAKAGKTSSERDKLDQDFLDNEAGIPHARKMEEKRFDHNANIDSKAFDKLNETKKDK